MKALFLMAILLAALAARGQTNAVAHSSDSQLSWRQKSLTWEPAKKEAPNQIRGKRVTYSGIAVQLLKTDRPLQLINPAAPAEYSAGVDNIQRDPITKKASGFRLFSIEF